jgi:hypothetical protein
VPTTPHARWPQASAGRVHPGHDLRWPAYPDRRAQLRAARGRCRGDRGR